MASALVGAALVASAAVSPLLTNESSGGVSTTVTATMVGSDLMPDANLMLHLRRALFGGTLSSAWWSFVRGGTTYVVYYVHNGHGANPTNGVAALSGATAIEVDLGGVARSASAVATLTASACVSAGLTDVTASTADVEVPGASSGATGTGMVVDTSLRGMWGYQRFDHGVGNTGTLYTAAASNVLKHIASPGDGRVIGLYMLGQDNGSAFQPRLALGRGPAYSASPSTITVLGEGRVGSAISTGVPGVLLFEEPIYITASDELWLMWRANAGDAGYRLDSSTPTAPGDFTSSELLLASSTGGTDPTVAFGSTYSPTIGSTFSSMPAMGLIVELEDGSGNYRGDGSLAIRIGDQNTDPSHGTQTTAGPLILDVETLHFRFPLPQWTNFQLSGDRWVVGAWASGDDLGSVLYTWPDLDIPATTAPSLLASLGPLGIAAASTYQARTLSTAIDVGTETVGANVILGYGVNFGRTGGGAITTLAATYFPDTNAGDNTYQNCWVDDREGWHDFIPTGGGGYGSSATAPTEYATRGANGSTMPTRDPDPTWPSTFAVDSTPTTDIALPNLPLFTMEFTRAGITVVTA